MFATSEAQRKRVQKYREKILINTQNINVLFIKNKDYVEREKKDLKKDTLYKKV
jgi:DNA-binding PadR family transcriptional regulator